MPWGITGDSDWFGNYLNWPQHSTLENPCWACPANRVNPACSVSDCSVDAPFKTMLHGIDDDDSANPPVSTHPIMMIIGLIRACCHGDWQHEVDLGVLAYYLGSVLQEFLLNCYRGTLAERVQLLWCDIHEKYLDMKVESRLSNLTLQMFYNPTGFPLLHAKASESAALLHVLHDMSFALKRPGHFRDEVRHRGLSNLVICDNLIRKGGVFFNTAEAERLLAATDAFMLCQNWLLKDSLRMEVCLYHWSIKMHFMWHTAYMARFGNPRLLWCYGFEAWMGSVVTSAKACVAGTAQTLLGNKVLENSLLVMEIELREMDRLARAI